MNAEIERLVRENLPSLRGYIASLGAHNDLIDDLAQDVFLQVVKDWPKFDTSRSFRSWLFGIARNIVHQEFRKSKFESRVRQGFATEALIDADTAGREERGVSTGPEAVTVMRTCVEKLSDKMKHFIELRFRQRSTTEEIARAVGMTNGAVRVSLMRMREALRACMESKLENG
ncbi:MAG: hypothetical protein C0404_07805 [Verrucomicrobia bacterium]|nr:hypothetical protein [Verrucomicrobiota bacterium]